MGKLVQIPSALPPAPAVMAILSRFDRKHLSAFMEVAVELLDTMDGDPDAEDDDPREDDDPGGGNVEDEGECIDEREPDHDAEVETWAHWLDHPAELHIGKRPGHTD